MAKKGYRKYWPEPAVTQSHNKIKRKNLRILLFRQRYFFAFRVVIKRNFALL